MIRGECLERHALRSTVPMKCEQHLLISHKPPKIEVRVDSMRQHQTGLSVRSGKNSGLSNLS